MNLTTIIDETLPADPLRRQGRSEMRTRRVVIARLDGAKLESTRRLWQHETQCRLKSNRQRKRQAGNSLLLAALPE